MDPEEAPKDAFPETFKKDFAKVEALIADEWPSIDRAALAATAGDLARVVQLVTAATTHTKAVARAKLRELHELATEGAKQNHAGAAGDPLRDALDRIERRVSKLASDVRGQATSALPAVKTFARDNFWWTLFIVLGLGFLLGATFGPRRGRRD